MELVVDMEKLLKFCPFENATAFVSYGCGEITIAFEWLQCGERKRFARYLSVFELTNTSIGIDGALTCELHIMRQKMELMLNTTQPV